MQLLNVIAEVTDTGAVPLCGVNVPPMLAGAQSVVNALPPLGGPVMFSLRSVSGTSGTFANVTEFWVRLTAPGSVIPSVGKEIAIVGAVAEPDSVTLPFDSATLGTSGEVAVAVPTVHPVAFRHGTSAWTFGFRPWGSWSTMDLLADSLAAWVISVTSVAPLPLESLVIEPVSFGAYGRLEQPVTLSGAVAVFDVASC